MDSYMVCMYSKCTGKRKNLYYNLQKSVAKSIVRHMSKTNNSAIYWAEVEPMRYW